MSHQITEQSFIEGKATIKEGRKSLGWAYHRPVFYAVNKITAGYSSDYAVVLRNLGGTECKTLEEVNNVLNKYL